MLRYCDKKLSQYHCWTVTISANLSCGYCARKAHNSNKGNHYECILSHVTALLCLNSRGRNHIAHDDGLV